MIEQYHKPASVEDAIALKRDLADRACFLGGGTQVNSLEFPLSPQHVISLERLGLAGIEAGKTEWTIGASCTIQQLIESQDAPECVQEAGRQITNRNLRNMATIGGHLAGPCSTGELATVLAALEAQVDVTTSSGQRSMTVPQYVASEHSGALILRIRIPKPDHLRQLAMDKFARTACDVPVFCVAVALERDGESIAQPVVAIAGSGQPVGRLDAVESRLNGLPLPTPSLIESCVAAEVSPEADIRGSVAYKRHLAGVLIALAVRSAYDGEGGRIA